MAQAETPKPLNFCSEGSSSQRAWAPVAMISVSAQIDVAGVAFEPERPLREVDLADVVVDELGADVLGLRLHLLHQPRALDDVGEARVVLDVGGDGELAAGLDALDQDRLQHGARGIDGGGVAGGAGADDDDFRVGGLAHGQSSPCRR